MIVNNDICYLKFHEVVVLVLMEFFIISMMESSLSNFKGF